MHQPNSSQKISRRRPSRHSHYCKFFISRSRIMSRQTLCCRQHPYRHSSSDNIVLACLEYINPAVCSPSQPHSDLGNEVSVRIYQMSHHFLLPKLCQALLQTQPWQKENFHKNFWLNKSSVSMAWLQSALSMSPKQMLKQLLRPNKQEKESTVSTNVYEQKNPSSYSLPKIPFMLTFCRTYSWMARLFLSHIRESKSTSTFRIHLPFHWL